MKKKKAEKERRTAGRRKKKKQLSISAQGIKTIIYIHQMHEKKNLISIWWMVNGKFWIVNVGKQESSERVAVDLANAYVS